MSEPKSSYRFGDPARLIVGGQVGLMFQFINLFMLPYKYDPTTAYVTLLVFMLGLAAAVLTGWRFCQIVMPRQTRIGKVIYSPPVLVFTALSAAVILFAYMSNSAQRTGH